MSRPGLVLPPLAQEELAAAGAGGPVPLTLVDGLGPAARAAALDAGRRSLLARRLLFPDGTAAPPLRAIVALRRAPGVRLLADRTSTSGDPGATAWCHVAPTRPAALDERPGADGVHRFALRSPDDAAAALAAFADPGGEGRAGRRPEPADPGRALATATTVTRVAAARATPAGPITAAVTVAAGPLGAWVVVADEPAAHASPVGARALAELFALLLALPYIDSGAVTPSSPSPTTSPMRAASTSHSRAAVSSAGTPSPIT